MLGPILLAATALAQSPPPTLTMEFTREQYAAADIAYGARLYAAQCATCHGPTGDGVGGVDLRSGHFRHGTSDQDLMRIMTTGIPGTGMLGFKLDPPETAALVAYLRNMNSFDPASSR